MKYSRNTFTLNLHDATSQTYLRIKNGDISRQYIVTLVDGDTVYQLADDCYARLTGKTPSGEIINTNCRIIDNKVVFNLTPSISKSIGMTECEIRVYSRDNAEQITSPRFYIYSEESLYNEVLPDPPVYSASVVVLSLPSYAWVGEKSPWSQVAMIDKATAHTKCDLQPTPAQLENFRDNNLAFSTVNDGGTITVYAVGDKPTEDLTMQATLTEVS